MTLSKDLFAGKSFSMIRRTATVSLYLPQRTNTCSKAAAKTLKITEDNSNEELSQKQSPDVFYKKVFLFSKIHGKTRVPESAFQ